MNSTIIIQCAWCRDIKVGGRYTHLAVDTIVHEMQLPAKHGKVVHYAVSHGICGPCKQKLLGHSLAA